MKRPRVKKGPTRKQLLGLLGKLQTMLGEASAFHANDRNPDGFEKGQNIIHEAFELCIKARENDPIVPDWSPVSKGEQP